MNKFADVMDVIDDFVSDVVNELEKMWKSVIELKDADDLNKAVNDVVEEIDKLIDKLS